LANTDNVCNRNQRNISRPNFCNKREKPLFQTNLTERVERSEKEMAMIKAHKTCNSLFDGQELTESKNEQNESSIADDQKSDDEMNQQVVARVQYASPMCMGEYVRGRTFPGQSLSITVHDST
jgi:hypothetical protein